MPETSPAFQSGLDRLIPPEIARSKFARALSRLAATPGVRTILEIGASSGGGSTEALVAGALRQAAPPQIHSLEVSKARFAAFQERWKEYPFVHGYNVSSVPVEKFPSEAEVTAFWTNVRSKLRNNRLEKVLGWLRQDLDYLTHHDLSREGILEVKKAAGVEVFDAVLIDGSEFTGKPELELTWGARFIALDDTRSFKNLENKQRLCADPKYRLVEKSFWHRNGYAIFERAA